MSLNLARMIAAFAACAATTAAMAAGYITGNMKVGSLPNWTDTEPVVVEHSATDGYSRAALRGSLSSGGLGAEAYNFASASVLWDETIVPSGIALFQLYFRLHAKVSPANGEPGFIDPSTHVTFQVRINGDAFMYTFTNGICPNPRPAAGLTYGCTSDRAGIDYERTLSLPFFVLTASPVRIISSLTAYSWRAGEWADAFHSADFYLDVPDGVTYTSSSGLFLSTATPVPEAPTWVTLALGAAATAGFARRRRASTS